MPKFAVYYIPPAASKLYQRGSEILGYDVRAGIMLPSENPSRAALPEFEDEWVAQPQTYGFHVTTGYSLYFNWDRLPEIEQELDDVFKCFSPGVDFVFDPTPEQVVFWHDEIVVLRYNPNAMLMMLHAMITARVNPLGMGSNISDAHTRQGTAGISDVNVNRVRKYFTPYILDGWTPHFTLMMPYKGKDPEAMRTAIRDLFDAQSIHVDSICLLVREDGETHYRLHREYSF